MAKGQGRIRPKSRWTAEDLPDAELEILACLWNGGDTTAAELRARLAKYRPMAHGSVLTLLGRLMEKGLVTREKSGQGKAFAFRAVPPPAPTYRKIFNKLIERVFDGNAMAMVASLLDSYAPSEEELKQIRRMLDQRRKSGGGKKKNK